MSNSTDYLNFHQVGNLVRDPELITTATGKMCMRANLAYGPKGSSNRNFVPVTIWLQDTNGKSFDPPMLHKGDFVKIAGNIRQETWDKEDGTKASIFKVHCTPNGVSVLKAKAAPDQQETLLSEEV